MAASDIAERVRNYVSQLSDEELDCAELISNIIDEIEDWWEAEDDNLSSVASMRRKIQAVTEVVNNVLIKHWNNANDSIYDAVQRAVESNLYNVVAQRQKVRKSVSAKQNAYIAKVVKEKLIPELPRNVPDSPVRTVPNVTTSRDHSDETARDDVLRGNPSQPSVNPLAFGDPAPLHDTFLQLQPDILPNVLNVPSLNITAIEPAQVLAPDLSIEEQMLNIPLPELVTGQPEELDPTGGDVASRNITEPDNAAIGSTAVPEPVPDLVPSDTVADFQMTVPVNDPPAEVVAEPQPNEPNATLPDSNTVDSSLPPVRPSQIPQRKRALNKNLIIDKVTEIKNYAARSMKLNKSQQVKRTDPNWCELQKYKSAISVPRLFSSPACTPMYNPVRANKLTTLYTRHLIVDPCLVRERAPVPVQAHPISERPASQEDIPVRLAQSIRRVADQIVASPGVSNLGAETSHPVTVIPPTPETPSFDALVSGITANVLVVPVGDTESKARRVSSDIFRAVDDTRSEGVTIPVHQMPDGVVTEASTLPVQTGIADDAQTRVEETFVVIEPGIASQAQTEIPAVVQVFHDEARVEAFVETSIADAAQAQAEIPAVDNVQMLPGEARVEAFVETSIVDAPPVQTEIPAVQIPPDETRAAATEVRIPSAGLIDVPTASDVDAQPPHIPQVPSTGFQNIMDLLDENAPTPITNLMGGTCTKRSKIALMRKLLQLNRRWLVQILAINGQIFVTKFPNGMADIIQGA